MKSTQFLSILRVIVIASLLFPVTSQGRVPVPDGRDLVLEPSFAIQATGAELPEGAVRTRAVQLNSSLLRLGQGGLAELAEKNEKRERYRK